MIFLFPAGFGQLSAHGTSPGLKGLRGLRVGVGAPGRGGPARALSSAWRGNAGCSGGVESGAASAMRGGKDGLIGTAGCHGEFDPADADGDKGANLEQLATDSAAGRVGEIGRLQGQTAHTLDQHIRVEANHRRSWLAAMVWVEVQSANKSI